MLDGLSVCPSGRPWTCFYPPGDCIAWITTGDESDKTARWTKTRASSDTNIKEVSFTSITNLDIRSQITIRYSKKNWSSMLRLLPPIKLSPWQRQQWNRGSNDVVWCNRDTSRCERCYWNWAPETSTQIQTNRFAGLPIIERVYLKVNGNVQIRFHASTTISKSSPGIFLWY